MDRSQIVQDFVRIPLGQFSVSGNRREQRRLDQAAGLVPFATKLNADLVAQLNALAGEQGTDIGTVVTTLLQKGLAS